MAGLLEDDGATAVPQHAVLGVPAHRAGEGNPLGARALYLGNTLYRIHGTNQPSTIGTFVSSGCIRLTNEDIADLYGRVSVGTRVVVLPGSASASVSSPAPIAR